MRSSPQDGTSRWCPTWRCSFASSRCAEGLRSRLMLALYRSARQAEALQVYQQARRVLVEELGIEPGRPLRELHRQILAQDDRLELSAGVSQAGRAAGCGGHRHGGWWSRPADGARCAKDRDRHLDACRGGGRRTAQILDPEAQRQVVGRAFGEVEAAVASHGGTVVSVTGEAVTAVFGVPVVHEDDATAGDSCRRRAVAIRLTELGTQSIDRRQGHGWSSVSVSAPGGSSPGAGPVRNSGRPASR